MCREPDPSPPTVRYPSSFHRCYFHISDIPTKEYPHFPDELQYSPPSMDQESPGCRAFSLYSIVASPYLLGEYCQICNADSPLER